MRKINRYIKSLELSIIHKKNPFSPFALNSSKNFLSFYSPLYICLNLSSVLTFREIFLFICLLQRRRKLSIWLSTTLWLRQRERRNFWPTLDCTRSSWRPYRPPWSSSSSGLWQKVWNKNRYQCRNFSKSYRLLKRFLAKLQVNRNLPVFLSVRISK